MMKILTIGLDPTNNASLFSTWAEETEQALIAAIY